MLIPFCRVGRWYHKSQPQRWVSPAEPLFVSRRPSAAARSASPFPTLLRPSQSPPLWTTTTLHFIVEAVALATEIAPSFLAFLTSDRASGRHHMRSENAATRRDT
ncbi:hypothetical protein CGCF413_v000612 [Colletotrichum fructicola]|nr:hypothetical protein CGCF413_v000612 [Colletotrichum fructicola]